MRLFNGCVDFCIVLPVCLLLSIHHLSAADGGADINPNDDGIRQAGMVTPTPLDKLIALNMHLGKKVNWKQVAKAYKSYMDVGDFKDENVMLPVLMGMRMSDGVIAVQARDVEVLNAAAADIEVIAKLLGVGDGQLMKAKKVRVFANKSQWNRVFMELGFLQNDVLGAMAKEGGSDRRAILLAAGWIQGVHIISGVVKENYSADTSGLLREPLLVRQMIKDLEVLRENKRKDVVVVEMLAVLKKLAVIIDVPINSGIAGDKIKEMHDLTSNFSELVLKEKR